MLENRSDYDIVIELHQRITTNLGGHTIRVDTDGTPNPIGRGFLRYSIYLAPGDEWEKGASYSFGSIRSRLSVDSATIIYNKEKIRIHAPVLNLEKDTIYSMDSNLEQLIDTKRYIFSVKSYTILDEQPYRNLWGREKGCYKRTYYYTFTNADYEAAKPIDP